METRRLTGATGGATGRDDDRHDPLEPLDETIDRSHCLETRRLSTGATGDDRQEPLETTIDSTGATGDDRQHRSHWRQSTGATAGRGAWSPYWRRQRSTGATGEDNQQEPLESLETMIDMSHH